MGMATASRIRMMLITTIISMRVNPRSDFAVLFVVVIVVVTVTAVCCPKSVRPGRIGSSVARHVVRTAVHSHDARLVRIPGVLRIFLVELPGVGFAGNVLGNKLDVTWHQIL